MLTRYRATGADLPFGDPVRAHGVAMEGYFWRLTDPATGRVLVALCGVHRGRAGRTWANVALAAHPGGVVRAADIKDAFADPERLGVRVGDDAFVADEHGVRVDLGEDARLDLRLHDRRPWPRRVLGGLGAGQVVPLLSQHWHPHLLGAEASGTARIGGEDIDLRGFRVYAEKNWGREGFPAHWWWGQAHSFPDADVCVAFAGGSVDVGPVHTTATAIAVRLGDDLVRLGDPFVSRAHADVGEGGWRLRARGPRHAIEIEGHAAPGTATVLPVPLPASGYSVAGALQHFAGDLELTVRRGSRVVFRGHSPLAGLERGGADRLKQEIADQRAAATPVTAADPAPAPVGPEGGAA